MPKLRVDLPDYLAFRASAQTAGAIREQAERDGVTVSAVIRETLDKHFPQQSPPAPPERASLCTP